MIEILKNPMKNLFLNLCKTSKISIKLCAPFVKCNVVKEIIDIKNQNTSIDLITNVNINNFHKKSSDIAALNKMLEINDFIYNKGNLHAKYYIFDDKKAIITSGNLTTNGLTNNYEYGIFTDDDNLLKQITADYSNICDDENTGKVNKKHLKAIEEMLLQIDKSNVKIPSIKNILTADIDNVLHIKVSSELTNQFKGWKKDIFEIIDINFDDTFKLTDFKKHICFLEKKHPTNNNIEVKVRQQLQYLRDIGFIEFLGSGHYKKLWSK